MFYQLFIKAGLSEIQAETLDYLIRNGLSKAIDITKNTTRARGVVYKALEELVEMKLVEKIEKHNQITRFRAEHPAKIEEFFDDKERRIKNDRREFADSLPDLISAYNLTANKPGVKFLEGDAGVRAALFDTLKTTAEIYTFADVLSIEKNLKKINDEYAKKRERLGIKKKIIVSDMPENRKFFENFNSEITQVKFIKQEYYPFQTGMQIYANKISYQTLEKDNKIAVIIEDKNIYQMHKLFFEYIWSSLD